MKKSTVAAGCIAGVVAACSGAGLEAIGDTMHDAGHAMAGVGGRLEAAGGFVAGAGHLIAGAGSSVEAAGSALAAGGSAGASGAQAQEAVGDGLPRPRWVLRDKDGTPVQADVTPSYALSSPRFESTPDCVHMNHLGQRRIGLTYTLSAGALGKHIADPCSGLAAEQAAWRPATNWLFADKDCTVPVTYGPSYVVSIGGKLFHSGTAPLTPTPTMVYGWSNSTEQCVENTPVAGTKYWAFAPIPTDVLNLLPNPPYTLELAY